MGRDIVYTFGNLHALPCVPAAFYITVITDHRLMSCIIRFLPNPDRNSPNHGTHQSGLRRVACVVLGTGRCVLLFFMISYMLYYYSLIPIFPFAIDQPAVGFTGVTLI